MVQRFHSIASITRSNQHRESFPYELDKYQTQDVTAGRRGDGSDDGAGGGDNGDDDPDEVQLDGGGDGDDFPPPGRNFPGRFLPAGEFFFLSGSPPRSGGGIFLCSLLQSWGSRKDEIREGATSEVGQGGHTMPRRGLRWART